MKASIVPDMINVAVASTCEGTLCLVVDCRDFDHFTKLPAALLFEGRVCGKSGWNSDRGAAYYQSSVALAHVVK